MSIGKSLINSNNLGDIEATSVVITNPGIGFQYFDGKSSTPVMQIDGATRTVFIDNITIGGSTNIGPITNISIDDGSAASPSFAFNNELTTGIYRPTTGEFGITVLGSQVAYFNYMGLVAIGGTFTGPIFAADGSALAPSISFNSSNGLGFYRSAANVMGITAAGVSIGSFSSAGLSINDITVTTGNIVLSAPGATVDGVDISAFKADYDSKINQALLTTSSPTFADLTITGEPEFPAGINIGNGSAAVPSLHFTSDPQTGWYRGAPNEWHLSVLGVDTFSVGAGGIYLNSGNFNMLTGNIILSAPGATVDGVDISAFKADYDSKVNQAVLTTSSPTFAGLTVNGNIVMPTAGATVDGVDLSAFKTDYDSKINQALLTTSSPTFVNLTLTGRLRVGFGTLGAPSLYFGTDTTSGFYRPVANAVSFVSAGAESVRMTFGSIGIPQLLYNLLAPQTSISLASVVMAFAVNGVSALDLSDINAQFINGSSSSPGITFQGDQGSGLFLYSGGVLGVAASGFPAAFGPVGKSVGLRLGEQIDNYTSGRMCTAGIYNSLDMPIESQVAVYNSENYPNRQDISWVYDNVETLYDCFLSNDFVYCGSAFDPGSTFSNLSWRIRKSAVGLGVDYDTYPGQAQPLNNQFIQHSQFTPQGFNIIKQGSVSEPSFYLFSDNQSGMYQRASNKLSFTISGVQAGEFGTITSHISPFYGLAVGLSIGAGNFGGPADNIPAKLEIIGDIKDASGPFISFYNNPTLGGDTVYPSLFIRPYYHDDVSLYFDCFTDNKEQNIASSTSVSWRMRKTGGVINFDYAPATSEGSNISFTTAVSITTAGITSPTISGDLTVTGNIIMPTAGATVDGVDLSAFKADYDSKINQALLTTSSPTFVGLTLTGRLVLSAGSAAAPSLYFTGATTTGWFQRAAGKIDITITGTQAAEWGVIGSTRGLTIGGNNSTTISSKFDIVGTDATTGAAYQNYYSSDVVGFPSLAVAAVASTNVNYYFGGYFDGTSERGSITTGTIWRMKKIAASLTFDYATAPVSAGGTVTYTNLLTLSSTGFVVTGTIRSTTFTANSAVSINASGNLVSQTLTNGQLLIGSTGAAPVAANLISGTGITVTNGAGTITIATSQDVSTAGSPTFVRTILSGAGATTSPTLQFTGSTSTNTGFYVAATNSVAFVANSASIITLGPSGVVFNSVLASSVPYIGPGKELLTQQLTNGQLLIGATGLTPNATTLTATANQTTITNGSGTITIGTVQSIGTTSSPTFAGLTLTGNLGLGSGTVANPSLFFTVSNISGLYSRAADKLDISITSTRTGEWGAIGPASRGLTIGNANNSTAVGAKLELVATNATTDGAYMAYYSSDLLTRPNYFVAPVSSSLSHLLWGAYYDGAIKASLATGNAWSLRRTTKSMIFGYSAMTSVDATLTLTDVLGVTSAGINLPLQTASTLLALDSSKNIVSQSFTANGQLIIGAVTGGYSVATLTAGAGVSITNGAGSISIATTGTPSFTTLTLSPGSAAAPSLVFTSSATTGMYSSATNKVNFAVSGALAVEIGAISTGRGVNIGGTIVGTIPARLELSGPGSSATSPSIVYYTTTDNFPIVQSATYSHNFAPTYYDCYNDGTDLRTSITVTADVTSNIPIAMIKSSTSLRFLSMDQSSLAAGSIIPSFTEKIRFELGILQTNMSASDGFVTISQDYREHNNNSIMFDCRRLLTNVVDIFTSSVGGSDLPWRLVKSSTALTYQTSLIPVTVGGTITFSNIFSINPSGLQLISGSAAAPVLSFFSSATTGIYSSATNKLDITVSGAHLAQFGTSLTVGGANVSTSIASKLEITGTNNSVVAGAFQAFYTDADAFPIVQIVPLAHNDSSLLFDCYVDTTGAGIKSSVGVTGRSGRIRKFGTDMFIDMTTTGVAAGSAVAFSNKVTISQNGCAVAYASGTVGGATIYFDGEPGTGFYRPAVGVIGVAISTAQVAAFNSSGLNIITAGSAATPSLYFSTDTTSGFYRSGAGEVSFSSGGVQSVILSSAGVDIPVVGSAASPSLVLTSNNTGMFVPVANSLGFSANGAERVRVDATNGFCDGNYSLTSPFYSPFLSLLSTAIATSPNITFSSVGVSTARLGAMRLVIVYLAWSARVSAAAQIVITFTSNIFPAATPVNALHLVEAQQLALGNASNLISATLTANTMSLRYSQMANATGNYANVNYSAMGAAGNMLFQGVLLG